MGAFKKDSKKRKRDPLKSFFKPVADAGKAVNKSVLKPVGHKLSRAADVVIKGADNVADGLNPMYLLGFGALGIGAIMLTRK